MVLHYEISMTLTYTPETMKKKKKHEVRKLMLF